MNDELQREQERLLGTEALPQGKRSRLDNIDFVRGAVMIVMALDHIRGPMGPRIDPTNLAQTTPMIFFTRWLTHYCAPTFVFLAGTGAFLSGSKGKSRGAISRDFFFRGLWLAVLEFTLVRFGWSLSWEWHNFFGGVIWAIGASMMVMSVLVWLPVWLLGAFGLLMICLHNLLDYVTPDAYGVFDWVWKMLHSGGAFVHIQKEVDGKAQTIFAWGAGYPLVPWIGVMAAGYAFGAALTKMHDRRRFLIDLGLVLIVAFGFVRGVNKHGDPQPWSEQYRPVAQVSEPKEKTEKTSPGKVAPKTESADKEFNLPLTICSFCNCHKYPPSLSYLLMTLGPAIFVMGLVDRPMGWFGRQVIVFGRVPLFFYLLHLPLINLFTRLSSPNRLLNLQELRKTNPDFVPEPDFHDKAVEYIIGHVPTSWGWTKHSADLLFAYLIWICVILILFPLCYWFAGVKKRRKDWWLSYL